MTLIAETDVKKDARNRITLPPTAQFEHYHVMEFNDGHIELYPRVLVDPLISRRTLDMMDKSMDNFRKGIAGDPLDLDAMQAALETGETRRLAKRKKPNAKRRV
jgi:hypothetical protein